VVANVFYSDAQAQPAAPAKVFAFPTASRSAEAPKPVPEPEIVPDATVEEKPAPTELALEEEASAAAEELSLDMPADEANDELLLGSGDMLADSQADEDAASGDTASGTRSWLTGQESAPASAPRSGGTLFERMSNIARGAAKAQVDEDPLMTNGREPLDIPRFLNRQNNQ
jgi:cell division protein FtsZ